ncbi:MAG: DUF3298 domain-containing protein [Candidatus Nomurabacteria bacterium]
MKKINTSNVSKSNSKIKIVISILIILIASFAIFYTYKKPIINIFPKHEESILNASSSISFNESNDFYTINANYPNDPIDKNGVIKTTVEYWINQDKQDWKIGGDTYNSEIELRKKYPDMSKPAYELDINYTKEISEKFQTVTYTIEKYEFTGGAHGNTIIATFTFDKNGQITTDDLFDFKPEQNKSDIDLVKILSSKLEKSLGEDLDKDMLSQGLGLAYYKADGSFDKKACSCDGFLPASNFQNFSILDEGIKFKMNQYSVAPYVDGMPEAIIPWLELKPFLSKYFLNKLK